VAAGGENNSCVVLADRTLWCWGTNAYGEVGNGTTTSAVDPVLIDVGNTIAAIAAYGGQGQLQEGYTCSALTNGDSYCWGANNIGQLGNGSIVGTQICNTAACSPTPTKVGLIGVAQFATGGDHACAIMLGTALYCWGANDFGQLGDGTQTAPQTCTGRPCQPTPQLVPGLSNVTSAGAGVQHTCAVALNTVYCWGANGSGQLGDGTTGPNRRNPTAVTLAATPTEVATGRSHTCAVLIDHSLWCWGFNGYGQLGINSTTNTDTPTQVTALGTMVAHVGAGQDHTCALLLDNTTWCWGASTYGQSGPASPNGYLFPIHVTVGPAVAISANNTRSCALLVDGSVWCWGIGLGAPKAITTFCQ
jgi:alpha-tubulin suppressor-like RCC1 family protein